MKLTTLLYRAARLSNDLDALAKPERLPRRVKNKVIGRALGRARFWRWLWR